MWHYVIKSSFFCLSKESTAKFVGFARIISPESYNMNPDETYVFGRFDSGDSQSKKLASGSWYYSSRTPYDLESTRSHVDYHVQCIVFCYLLQLWINLTMTVVQFMWSWTTKDDITCGLLLICLPIQLLVINFLRELSVRLGGTCCGYAFVTPSVLRRYRWRRNLSFLIGILTSNINRCIFSDSLSDLKQGMGRR